MNRFGNTSWLSSRQVTQRAAVQQLPAIALRPLELPFVESAQRAIAFIPSWIILAMILMAVTGICATVVTRARAQFRLSQAEHNRMTSDIDGLRRANAALQIEIRRMTTEPATIESTARARLGMVRPTDIIVPVESQTKTNLATLSFVR
ncbi:MAG TPA: septum formation initiator family protein [Pyrinomonadaceae bacterium]|nr:septum formation initiator family protein [Pyrinomonadaceae bacterium]